LVLLQACFKTTPEVTKLELREFLEKVYGYPVLRVDTALVAGKVKKMSPPHSPPTKMIMKKEPDFKKAWVQFASGRISRATGPGSGLASAGADAERPSGETQSARPS
jgi:ribosomal protein L23